MPSKLDLLRWKHIDSVLLQLCCSQILSLLVGFHVTDIHLTPQTFLQELNAIFEKIDTDHSGLIDFDEFVTGVAKFVLEKSPNGTIR